MSDTLTQPSTKAPWPRLSVFKIEPDGGWFVPSNTKPGVWYRVEFRTEPRRKWWTCTCRYGKTLGEQDSQVATCSHVGLVGRAEREDGIAGRPAARVNAGIFCD